MVHLSSPEQQRHRVPATRQSRKPDRGASAAVASSGVSQELFGASPAQAAIGNRNAIAQRAIKWLAAIEQMALQHHATQAGVACETLFKHAVEHGRLAQRVLATVGVTAIDH